MKDDTSIFGAKPDHLDKLVFHALEQSEEDNQAAPTASLDAILERHGDRIGRYKMLGVLGEGGMGVVHLAEQQQPIKRRVALKVIKPGMDSASVIARFEAERQALALLDHPNIAHVYDAGTTEAGRPYFVMEYIKGLSITEHCDRHKLTIDDRLRLFLQVCHAVQHAHQKGIIHRDIKPSNILISTPDDEEVPKIIDFGVAKALAQPLTERTLVTERGQLFGTPEYMSPEQADETNEDIDTRSDIYSLGVVLYQLLTGVLPFDSGTLREGGMEHVRRVICEKDPKTPSTRLTGLGEEAEIVAQKRQTDVTSLTRRLHRELEWIPLKAMRKDRTRRYRSAAEFADDIENYLGGIPLIAGPESVTYRVGKFVRRHRAVALTVSSVAAVLIIATLISTVSYVLAVRAREIAEQERGRADRNAYVSDMSRAAHAWETGDLLRARNLLYRHRSQSSSFGEASFEWRLLWGLAHEEKTLFGFHAGAKPVAAVALSAQGRFLAWCVDGGSVRIVDLEKRREHLKLPSPASRIHSLAFSANRQWLAIGGDDGLITIWNVSTWTIEASLEGHRGRISHLSFSTDERRLVSLSNDNTVRIWDLTEWVEVSAYPNPEGNAQLSVSSDGRLLAAFGGLNNTVRFYDLEPNLPLRATLPRQKGVILSVEFASDANSAFISAHDSSVTHWKFDPLQPLMNYWQKVLVYQVALSADGRILATAGGDNLIRIWDVASGQELRVLRGHTAAVSHLYLSADGRTLVSADADNRINVWTTDPTSEVNVLSHEGIVVYTAVAPEGELLATSNPNFFTVDLWDLRSGAATRFVADAKAEPAFSPDGKWLALRRFTDPIEVELWDRTTTPYRKVQALPCAQAFGMQLGFSPDSRILVFRAPGEVMELWDTVARQSRGQLPDHPSNYCGTAFSSDGQLIATACDGRIRIWHVRSQELLATIGEQHYDARSLCFSSDDNMLIAASGYTEIRRWDITDPENPHLLPPLRGHTAFVNQIALSPDGKTLASAGWDSTLRLWDPLDGRELMALQAHSAVTACLAWSPDGQSLYTGSGDTTVRIWRAPTDQEILTQNPPSQWNNKHEHDI